MHARLSALLLVSGLCIGASCAPAGEAPCASLQACVGAVRKLAAVPGPYAQTTTIAETALLARLRSFDGAVPQLVALLEDPDDAVANIAAVGLRDAEYIDPVFLPQIIAGLDRGLGWLAPALGRMPSDAAAREAVARLLVSDSAPHNQEAYAVELAGRRAVPFIVEAARCTTPCAAQDHYLLGYVLGEMGAERALAAPGLSAIAQDPQTPDSVAQGVLRMIAYLQEDAKSLEADLIALRKAKPELYRHIDDALIGMRSERTSAIFAHRLGREPSANTLRDLAETGVAAQAAGPKLIELLDHDNWEVRLAAARALGYVEYAPAAAALIDLLDEPSDIRLNWVAAEALGMMRNPAAIDKLQETSTSHWYPPVRQAAAVALTHIREGRSYASRFHQRNFPSEFYAYRSMGEDSTLCDSPSIARKPEPENEKLAAAIDPDPLQLLSYTATIVSYGASEETEAKATADSDTGIKVVELTPDNIVEHREEIRQIPDVALRVSDGWLLGSDRGEWGGELVYRPDQGAIQRFLEDNIQNIYRIGSRTIAVAGLAHLMSNHGMLYELTRAPDGQWSAAPWRSLPGAPRSSWLLETGDLLINVSDGGTLITAADGSMKMAPCSK
jgi:HEAT repeat protein